MSPIADLTTFICAFFSVAMRCSLGMSIAALRSEHGFQMISYLLHRTSLTVWRCTCMHIWGAAVGIGWQNETRWFAFLRVESSSSDPLWKERKCVRDPRRKREVSPAKFILGTIFAWKVQHLILTPVTKWSCKDSLTSYPYYFKLLQLIDRRCFLWSGRNHYWLKTLVIFSMFFLRQGRHFWKSQQKADYLGRQFNSVIKSHRRWTGKTRQASRTKMCGQALNLFREI